MENKSSFCLLLLGKNPKKRGKKGKNSFCSFDNKVVHVFGPFAVEKNHIVLYHAAKPTRKGAKRKK